MGVVSNIVRKIVFWNYPRTSWQWDVLCVLILVFIFLTPKSWFANPAYDPHTTVTPIVLPLELIGPQADKPEIERWAKQIAKRPNGQIIAITPLEEGGKLTGYQVDIR